jgi:hypothetical protein
MLFHTAPGPASASASIAIIPALNFFFKEKGKTFDECSSQSFKNGRKCQEIPKRNVTGSEWKRIPFWLPAGHSRLMGRFETAIEIHHPLLTRPNLGWAI